MCAQVDGLQAEPHTGGECSRVAHARAERGELVAPRGYLCTAGRRRPQLVA